MAQSEAQVYLTRVLQFLKRRAVLLVVVGLVGVVALLVRSITSSLDESAESMVPVGMPEVVSGIFRGVPVQDATRDEYSRNPWLLLAMNEGYTYSTSIRKYQIERIWLADGTHPETDEPAVILRLQPKRGELPDPPWRPVAVRRWQPEPGTEQGEQDTTEFQRRPNLEDLAEMRQMWSGGRYTESASLRSSFRWVFVLGSVAGALLLLAGAYRMNELWHAKLNRD